MCVMAEMYMAAFWLLDELKSKLYMGAVHRETTRGFTSFPTFTMYIYFNFYKLFLLNFIRDIF